MCVRVSESALEGGRGESELEEMRAQPGGAGEWFGYLVSASIPLKPSPGT